MGTLLTGSKAKTPVFDIGVRIKKLGIMRFLFICETTWCDQCQIILQQCPLIMEHIARTGKYCDAFVSERCVKCNALCNVTLCKRPQCCILHECGRLAADPLSPSALPLQPHPGSLQQNAAGKNACAHPCGAYLKSGGALRRIIYTIYHNRAVHVSVYSCISIHHTYPFISMHLQAYPDIFMHICAYQCISMHILAYICISLHIHAYPCTSMHIHP